MLKSMTFTQNKRIGVIGLGMLGSSIAERLLDKGLIINIYNRNQSKLKKLETKGAKAYY
ncbi:MAG: NAD(P)-binding domain-containing protein, partial [Candidatus Nitrosocosmicus sp.]